MIEPTLVNKHHQGVRANKDQIAQHIPVPVERLFAGATVEVEEHESRAQRSVGQAARLIIMDVEIDFALALSGLRQTRGRCDVKNQHLEHL
jgi:hypothetical protein